MIINHLSINKIKEKCMSISYIRPGRDFKSVELWKNVDDKDWNNPEWQLKNQIRDVKSLAGVIKLSDYQLQEIDRVVTLSQKVGKETLRITPYYASLIQQDPINPKMLFGELEENRLDPIFWQSVPTPANILFPNSGIEGAMAEEIRSYGAAYQRYPNRVALLVGENTNCASCCSHCQRAKSLDKNSFINSDEITKALFYIDYNENIDEVLVTGGDALMVSLKRLKYVLEELSKIDHLRSIRIASRVPIVMPMAITNQLLDLIAESANKFSGNSPKYIYFMTHLNHYQEITPELNNGIKLIRSHGFSIRNQTVLLQHVNANYRTLAETFRRMFWVGIEPYYLLQCHKEAGISHFITTIQIGKIYIKHLQGWLSGICKPIYAANLEGGGGKIILMHSGHDTLNVGIDIDSDIAEDSATINTWDDKIIDNYEALVKTTEKVYDNAMKSMTQFIGRENVFMPNMIITDDDGKYLYTSNCNELPNLINIKKARLLNYKTQTDGQPITNPFLIRNELDALFAKQKQ